MKCGEQVDYGREKSWLNSGSDLEHILNIVDFVSLPATEHLEVLQITGFTAIF